jgi:hypothetical protein
MPLPQILAGPILRRVEPTLVTVWVALSEERQVHLSLWEGLVKDDGASHLFNVSQPAIKPATDSTKTIRIGDHLHIAVIAYKLAQENALLPGRLYSYNLALKETAVGPPKEDLKSLKLLKNDPIDGKPHLALGYEPGFLPSFALPPIELTDLRIAHGSCRRVNNILEDGLAWVDDLIGASRTDPLKRFHQLLMTGDQIYADDVPLPLLPQFIERGRELLGNNEFLPTRWPNESKATYWPADAKHFPPALRQQLIISEARLTTADTHSHLISFGEFAAMYLFIWSNTLWDIKALKTFDEIIGSATTIPDNWGALFKRSREKKEDEVENDLLRQFVELLFTTLTKDELRRAMKAVDDGDPDPKERERRPLNPDDLTPERLAALKTSGRKEFKKIYDFAVGLTQEKLAEFKSFFEELQEDLTGLYEKTKNTRKQEVELFYNGLPKVRRALANVPTYMIFDDHEITDDWNLSPMWRDRVFTAPLGRTILRNGMLAYALFQGWGNDPEKFKEGNYAKLLKHASELFPTGNGAPPQVEPAPANEINNLFALDGNEDPPVKWNYTIKGPKHLLLVLDNRTRRSYVSRVGPPGNLSPKALGEQIPNGPRPPGIEVVVVVASLPVIGPPLVDEIIGPLSYRAYDLKNYIMEGNGRLKSMPGTNPDAVEAWAFDAPTFESLLKRLEPFRRVVLLSGDVHYGSSQALSYWKKDDDEPARFVQFTSSGLRNVMPQYVQLIDRSIPLAQRIIKAKIGIHRMGWNKNSPSPLTIPTNGANVVPGLRARLQQSPVLIPTRGWPTGTEPKTLPDWSWRVHILTDGRKESERPEPSRPAPLPAGTQANTIEGYRRIAVRHVKQFSRMKHGRQILFSNNLGVIRFEIKLNANNVKTLEVIQELYTVHSEAPNPAKPELYTLHRAALAALDGAKLVEEKPKIGD